MTTGSVSIKERKERLSGIEQFYNVQRHWTLSRAECPDPDRCVEEDHERERRRDLGRSISSFTSPIIAFNWSMRLRRINSCRETTIGVGLGLEPQQLARLFD